MPISYLIHEQKGFIAETWSGDIASADLAAYWRKYLIDSDVLALRRTLVDMRRCRILFSGEELSNLVHGIVLPIIRDADWRTAIVVSDSVQFGVSRQYHVFAEAYSRDAIFDEPDAALKWLLA
jgi:hypothetical protein